MREQTWKQNTKSAKVYHDQILIYLHYCTVQMFIKTYKCLQTDNLKPPDVLIFYGEKKIQ